MQRRKTSGGSGGQRRAAPGWKEACGQAERAPEAREPPHTPRKDGEVAKILKGKALPAVGQ